MPGFDLTLEQWESWSRLAASTRPRRALAKIAFGLAELFGLGKRGPLFEEATAVTMVRTVRQIVEHHPVIVASKRAVIVQTEPEWRASINAASIDAVTVTNTGRATWRAHSPSGIGYVRLGVQLLDADGRLLARDHHRVALPYDVRPGQAVTLSVHCPVPDESGRYGLKLDLVAEGVTWFETAGSTPRTLPLTVR